ncbi:rmlC-like jelly roll fold protein [Artemisia annua]|uniref:RmlC-like jelly roll fold protein n=1 Tax=Artemisia annua TaxID=35608 RepID=A0A2U1N8G9_ARTAN|nr:rmlC-like jelly roll fold protein [Artemisia annua]
MQPQSMFLPVQLYSEMILHVNSGNGTLSWIDVNEDDYQLQHINLHSGDIYRLQPLTVFYMENNLESDEALQICALFPDSEQELQNKQLTGVYVGVHDLVLGFDNKVLQAILSVPEEVVQELKGGERQPLIVQIQPEANNSILEVNSRVIRAFLGLTKNSNILDLVNKKKKKKNKKKKDKKKKDKKEEEEEKEAYNLFKADHDFDNDNGWSVTVTSEHFDVLKDSNFGVFMVNLTEGSMNGPHLNPASAQLAIVQRGPGMVQVVCPSIPSETICKNSRFKVEEGDVFVVPRYHLMAQMSFNNESFVFVGFTMTSKKNPPQYLAGKKSFLQTLDKTVLAKSFDIRNMTMMDEVLSTEEVSIILECKSCAEDQKKLMEEEAVWERVDIGGDKVSHWGDMEGDSRGWQWAESEGEMARRQEEDMQRRLMVAEQAAKRARRAMATKRAAAQEGCSCESRYPMKANRKEAYNLFKADHDFDNDNGWSVTVTSEHFDVLKDSNFGVFMVNLTEGSMNGPHLNPASAQLAIVQRGPGMVQVVCPSIPSETICKNSRFKVEEGDVFVVPRYHLMAQMSFNNESFVFVGFTMTSKKNPPQYLAGKKSFLQTLDKTVLAKSFDIRNMTMMDEVLSTEEVSIILECKSCAEDQKKLMEEEAVWERVDIGGDKVSHWGDMEGDSRGWQWAESEGEMARRQEEDMQRRLMVAEQAAKRARRAMATKRAAAQEGCSCESRYPMKANREIPKEIQSVSTMELIQIFTNMEPEVNVILLEQQLFAKICGMLSFSLCNLLIAFSMGFNGIKMMVILITRGYDEFTRRVGMKKNNLPKKSAFFDCCEDKEMKMIAYWHLYILAFHIPMIAPQRKHSQALVNGSVGGGGVAGMPAGSRKMSVLD